MSASSCCGVGDAVVLSTACDRAPSRDACGETGEKRSRTSARIIVLRLNVLSVSLTLTVLVRILTVIYSPSSLSVLTLGLRRKEEGIQGDTRVCTSSCCAAGGVSRITTGAVGGIDGESECAEIDGTVGGLGGVAGGGSVDCAVLVAVSGVGRIDGRRKGRAGGGVGKTLAMTSSDSLVRLDVDMLDGETGNAMGVD